MDTSAMVKTGLLAALAAVAAQIAIPLPFSPVPITLQVFVPLLAGAVLGPFYGTLSMVIYVLMGAIGLPVFAKGAAGLGVVIGPMGGDLLGFIAAALIVGIIVTKIGNTTGKLIVAMSAGVLVIYVLGVIQLALISSLTPVQAILAGAAPFILPDFIKAVIAATIARRIGFATGRGDS
ncbi:MAG: biotin transporter BioY [Candidatus Aquicultor sp.]